MRKINILKINILSTTLLFLMAILITSFAYAVPNLINYQGKLTDPNGVVLTGSYNLKFSLYTEKQGGSDLWNEQQTVTVTNGIYNVQLGSVEPFPANLFDNDPLYLEVRIFSSSTGWETFAPRERITSAAFAIKATSADMATDSDTVDGLQGDELEESAEIDSKINTHTAISGAHHTKTTSFTELTDTASDDQIPDDITVNYAKDADKVDGKHANEFLDTSSNTQTKSGGLNINGNVGIGTTGPDTKLEIKVSPGGSIIPALKLHSNSSKDGSGTSIDFVGSDDQTAIGARIVATRVQSGAPMDLRFHTGRDGFAAIIDNNRNVGIGTTSPAGKLHVKGGGLNEAHPPLTIEKTGASEEGLIAFAENGVQKWLIGADDYPSSPRDCDFIIYDSEVNAHRITVRKDNGNVGIGTTGPAGKLDVNGSIYQRGGVLYADYVFESEYKLETIDEHAKFMWENKHLKAIPKAKVAEDGQEIVEVGSHRKGIVEELEKAHIYIEQLHKRINEMESLIAKNKALEILVRKLSTRIEALESNN